MIIIGEKLNGAIPIVKEAIINRDAPFIAHRAKQQADAGADFIDLCAGTEPEREIEDLSWLMEIVQDAVDVPLCIDSPNPHCIKAVFPLAKQPGLLNSISGEGEKCELLLPLLKDNDWQVVALTCSDDEGIPKDTETKVAITIAMVEAAAAYGITQDRIHVDPCVLALATEARSLLNLKGDIQGIRACYPDIHITSGLSNISFGLPNRKLINRHFLALAMAAGMDSAVMDPCDEAIMDAIAATTALLGQDRFCKQYSRRFRKKRS
ncbi:methyltetrahydrofolate cobalamin methyltransferase [Eubacterium barkeri]|uniref:Methyltetrahydrofolate--corrinoid iron-sulfur protein Co-methyltransferase n=1 Tax=Eubacterium barkeri TaxID=1528 RepID=A0A1H3JU73_EUBBA|nr:methyltetrahydrofolate cobalamin methyltransferase [Eubacterium barkeri]SDY43507.1 methyltetrahydrofolate--corrinoid iron-sulfur protein Co-methyltransferase [Eubacterium barkeri]